MHCVEQVADLRKKIEDEQRMLMQWSEERLALAQSLLGLLELHLTQANKDITAFDSELQVCHVPHPFCITSFNLHDLQVQVCATKFAMASHPLLL